MNAPGLAVIYSEQYLLFNPASAEGFRLLGEARLAEDKPDLAVDAYSRALNSDGTDEELAEVYVSRAQLYGESKRSDLAQADLTAAIELDDRFATRALRMNIAYANGDFDIAREDAEILLGSGAVNDNDVQLILARILIDEAGRNDTADYNQALG
jgi:cytochrome c-type biogenesis protein CcmH/NrfG